MSFNVSVNKRIESIVDFEGTIKRINKLNDLILEAMAERAEFPIARDYFENTPQRERELKGLDTIWWHPVYSTILEKICKEGDFVEGVIEAESKLEELVYERIMIGRNVIKYKAPRGLNITRKQREEEILAEVRGKAPKYNLDPDNVEWIFRFIMDRNKEVQACTRSHGVKGTKLDEVQSCKTMQTNEYVPGDKSPVDRIRKRLQCWGDVLATKDGMNYYTIWKEKGSRLLKEYTVTLIRE